MARKTLAEKTCEIEIDNDVEIMPIVQNELFYNRWIKSYAFFSNIHSEGVNLYAA